MDSEMEAQPGKQECWKKIVDLKEAKKQALFALLMVVTNVSYYLINLVSVMYAGHLGELQLAGSSLANSWAIVTGFASMIGLSGALETLCGQGYGARKYKLMGIYLQTSCIISTIFAALISVAWLFTEPILIRLHQKAEIAQLSGVYMKYLIPGIFAYGFLQNILRFFQTQSVVYPMIACSVIPLGIHFGTAYALVKHTSLGFRGAALASSISLWLAVAMLATYLFCSKKFKQTWNGFSVEAFHHIAEILKLAVPSAGMVCLEYWVFEILVLLGGMTPNAELSTSLTAMCVNTETVAYMLAYGLAAVASTRVSNELGAGNPDRAKTAMCVTLKLVVTAALVVAASLAVGRKIWAGFFSEVPEVINAFSSMVPFLAMSMILDAIQGVISGVARGCGWQHIAVGINLGTFYFVGIPISCLLGFLLKLHVKGLWIGLICGLTCQSTSLMILTRYGKWVSRTSAENRDSEQPSTPPENSNA